jgi:leucyl-tRNA synthetase
MLLFKAFMENYDHKQIEQKWQKEWENAEIYKVRDKVDGKENYYTLVEFSYPSGNLHVGHWYAFSVPDIFARYKRMQGFNVLYPMGFDAFGLPAENAAIKLGADPKVWTYDQMDKMRTQLRSMGAMFDWSREIVSCDPSYYKWTQWMFNEFLKNDLVYRDVTKVNWCPKDQTILANEQVVDGKCERCGSEVIQRDQEQWMLRITKYADRLVDDLETLAWPEEIKSAQKNWIGRTEGAEIEFAVRGQEHKIKVFTTRPDTIFGATFIGVSAGLAQKWIEMGWNANQETKDYIAHTLKEQGIRDFKEKEKTGIYAGFNAINPANNEEIPVWITNYVLNDIGTGAVMVVPAHDERDFEFAKKFNLSIKQVIAPLFTKTNEQDGIKEDKKWIERDAVLCIVKGKNGKYCGVKWLANDWQGFVTGGIEESETIIDAARREVKEELGLEKISSIKEVGLLHTKFFHLIKDSNRFAHWHVVLVELDSDEMTSVSEEEKAIQVPVWLEESEVLSFITRKDVAYGWELYMGKANFTGEGYLYNSGKFDGLSSEEARKKITEFVGGKMVKKYRLRDWGISRQRYWGCPIPIVYDPQGKAHPVPKEHLPWLLPTDVDHTPDGTSPLARSKELFARTERIFGKGWKPEVETMDTFVDSSWYFYRYLDNQNENEFATKEKIDAWMPIDLYMGGAEHTTMHLLYSRFWVKAMHDLGLVNENEAYAVRRNRGLILGPDGNKMSKSKGNVINPDEIVDRLGADTVRMYLAFMGPYGVTTNYPWDPNGVVGVRRFLERVWRLKEKIVPESSSSDGVLFHQTIKGISEDIESYKFNTAIAKMMILLNAWEKAETISEKNYKTFLQLLAPFAPHITEELWYKFGEKNSIHLTTWPQYDPKQVTDMSVTIAVQVNGKVRAEIIVARDEDESKVKALACAHEKITELLLGKEPSRIIYVKNKLVSIVL